MENTLKNYKAATWILAIVVIVLAFWVIRLSNRDAETGIEAATATLQKCSDDLATWTTANPNPANTSVEAKEELANILKACSGNTSDIEEDETLPQ